MGAVGNDPYALPTQACIQTLGVSPRGCVQYQQCLATRALGFRTQHHGSTKPLATATAVDQHLAQVSAVLLIGGWSSTNCAVSTTLSAARANSGARSPAATRKHKAGPGLVSMPAKNPRRRRLPGGPTVGRLTVPPVPRSVNAIVQDRLPFQRVLFAVELSKTRTTA